MEGGRADLVNVAHGDGGEEDLRERRRGGVDGRHDGGLPELLGGLVHERRRHRDRRRHNLREMGKGVIFVIQVYGRPTLYGGAFA